MYSNNHQKDIYIKVNDIFDELNDENIRLNNELMFANNCLNVLNKFKEHLNQIYAKFEIIISLEDKQELNRLETEFNSLIRPNDPVRDAILYTNPSGDHPMKSLQSAEELIEMTEDCCNENTNQYITEIYSNNLKKKYQNIRNNQKKVTKNGVINERRQYYTEKRKKKFSCSYEGCGRPFDRESRLDEHIKQKHLSPEEGGHKKPKKNTQTPEMRAKYQLIKVKKYSCTYIGCGQRFDRSSRLSEHLKRKHTLAMSLKCNECGDGFVTEHDLKEHKLIHSENSFECDECHKLFARQSSLDKHKKTHIKRIPPSLLPQPTECDICHKMFPNLARMKDHRTHVHKTERIECDWPGCGQTFKYKKSYIPHRAFHMGVQQMTHKCDVDGCGRLFSGSTSLWQHKQGHLKSFACSWPGCDERFANEIERSGHLNRHLNVKPFKCNDCPKEYFTGKSLNKHTNKCHK